MKSSIKQQAVRLLNTTKVLGAGVFCFLIFSCQQVWAQAKFYQTAPKSVPVNGNFQLNITLENANGTNLRPPVFNDFQVLGGPNTSTSMQWINGNVTQSVTYSYILRPKKEGAFKIGKAAINVSGANVESNELSIEVTKPVQQQQQTQQRQRNPFDPFDDPFFNQQEPEPEVSSADISKQVKDDVFVKLSVNKGSVYNGEMLTATYKLYFRQNLNGLNVSKAPAFEGFWSQEVELDPQRRPGVETYNGKQYNTVEILKYNLYPQRSGNLVVAPAEISAIAQVAVRSKSRNIFDDFFGTGHVQQVPLTLKTESATVNVKELPAAGKPADFSGAVGKFNFETSLSAKEGKTDDPITYTIKISGTGNMKLIDAPALKLPPAFEVYDPKVKDNVTNGPNGSTGSKQYDYLIIPRQPGEYKIDKHVFSYFDPAAGKYFTITSPEYALKITGEPSKNPNTNAPAVVSKQDVSVMGQDIRYIKTNTPQFDKSGSQFFASAGYIAAYTAPLFLFIGLLAAKRRNETLAADVVGTKRRRAIKLAKKRLGTADKYLKQADKKPFYDEVSRAMWGYLGDKLSMDMAELSKDNVEEKLSAKSVKPETIAKLISLINTCDVALYAPIGEGGEMKTNYETALNLIADLEDEIRK
jgi:hypothetical protein